MNYYCEDFTQENYRKLLRIAKNHSSFHTYDEYKELKTGIIMRHDVDVSINRALEMAKIEKEEEITATYFIHLHSLHYNILEKDILKKVKEIIKWGGACWITF